MEHFMKNLFSFIMVGLAFTVLQVSISQAQGTSSDVATETSKQGGVLEDEGGRVKVWNRQTHGAKQGRIKQGTKISAKNDDEKTATAKSPSPQPANTSGSQSPMSTTKNR